MTWNLPIAFAVVCLIMYIGELCSIKSKGRIPQMFVVAFIFLIGFWTILPKDIIGISLLDKVGSITRLFVLIHVGAMFDLKQIAKDWRVAVTTLAAIAGILVFVLPIGVALFDFETAMVAIPPLTGGGMAALIMSDVAIEIGRKGLAMLTIIVFIMQGFVGFPLSAYFLRKEGERLVGLFRSNPKEVKTVDASTNNQVKEQKPKFIEKLPKKYRTNTFYLAQLGILALISFGIDAVIGKYVDKSLINVVVGFIAGHIGFLERDPIIKSQSGGILMMGLFATFMASFNNATPKMVVGLLIPIATFLLLASIGIVISSILVGKKMGYTKEMAAAIGLNCFLGFPYNYAITNEAVATVAENKEEAEFLTQQMLPKMIIGSLVSVSVVSTVLAGIFANFLR